MEYKLKKSFGQHFLKDENVSRKIIAALQHHQFNNLLEIGPGGGALTKHLLLLSNVNFKAVEVDNDKINYLLHTYPNIQPHLIHEDFLKMNKPFNASFAAVGNFPYNISSQILFKLLEWKNDVPLIIGMFQKEVAQRIAAKEGNKIYGILSVLVQIFYNVKYLFDVPAGSFQPPPKVTSGVIELCRKTSVADMRSEKDLFLLVKAAFNQRRKILRNSVRNLFAVEVLHDIIFNQRAEQLSIDEFAALTFKML